ncbi:MAG: catalase family protein [Cyclobacteriaceae bacterium]
MSAPGPGQEHLEANETTYAQLIADRFKETLREYYRDGSYSRMFHPKMHGLLRAEFIVKEDLPQKLKHGIFAKGQTFPAWVRLSNAKRKPSPDKNKDMRGMAIKLVGVPGTKLLKQDEEALTQDFLLVTAETLQTRSVKDFQKSIAALLGGGLRLFFYAITHPAVIIRSLKQITKCANVLEKQYFSMTPSMLGSDQAVKYSAVPRKKATSHIQKDPSDGYLRERLIDDLSDSDQAFDFMIQLQTDPAKMPVEDPTVAWDSPLIHVATIKIPKQTFDSEAQRTYGENLSFTPWHCLPAHRPLGGVNRARKLVYEQIAAFRRQHNDVSQTAEPEQLKTF